MVIETWSEPAGRMPPPTGSFDRSRLRRASFAAINCGQHPASLVQPGGMYSGSNQRILIGRGARPPFLVLSLQKLDIHLRAVDADKFASAIGQAGRRQQQKELLEIEALNGALHREYGVVVRYGVEEAIPAPRTVNGHDADAISAAERHAFRSLGVICHGSKPRHRSELWRGRASGLRHRGFR